MKKIYLCLFVGLVFTKVLAQPYNDTTIFNVADQMPSFQGGHTALFNYVNQHVSYPQEAYDKQISGKVYVSFVVEKDSSISNVFLVRDIGGGCGDEALQVVKNMPKWIPGIHNGKVVRVKMMLPVNFVWENVVLDQPDQMPSFKGGDTALQQFLSQNLVYPDEAKQNNVQGEVWVSFIVRADSSVADVQIIQDIGGGCGNEVLRVMKLMPKWNPGVYKYRHVAVRCNMPINFTSEQNNNIDLNTSASDTVMVDEMPSFPGGMQEARKFLAMHIKYPSDAKENDIEGIVYVSFIVEVDGSITNVQLVNEIGGGCGTEAVRVVKSMPKWLPGKYKGVPVRVKHLFSVNFILEN